MTTSRVDDMAVFCRVADLGSISAAARDLGLAPSSLSRRLSLLEASLGVPLINRTTRSLALTEAGREYLSAARGILAEVEALHTGIAALGTSPRGTLRVTAPVAYGHRYGARLLDAYRRLAPEVTVDLFLSDALVDLAARDVDIAIRSGNPDVADLVAIRLAPIRRHVIASPAWLEQHGEPMTPEELSSRPCLVFQPGGALNTWHFVRNGEERAVRLDPAFTCNNAEVVAQAVLAGLGIGLLPTWQVGEEIATGRLRTLLPGWEPRGPSASSHLWALYPRNRRGLPKIRLFLDLLRSLDTA